MIAMANYNNNINNTMYGNVSEADIIQTMGDLLDNSEGDDDISLAEFYNHIFTLHMNVFPQNTPAKLVLDNMANTHSLIKSSPHSKLYQNNIHDLYEAILFMGTFKLLKNSSLDMEPLKQCIRTAWDRYRNSHDIT